MIASSAQDIFYLLPIVAKLLFGILGSSDLCSQRLKAESDAVVRIFIAIQGILFMMKEQRQEQFQNSFSVNAFGCASGCFFAWSFAEHEQGEPM